MALRRSRLTARLASLALVTGLVGVGSLALERDAHAGVRASNNRGIEIEGATFETIVSRAAVEGLQCSGYNSNPSQRLELQGAPKFKGVCGPMWDGDAIRYECSATYAELSA